MQRNIECYTRDQLRNQIIGHYEIQNKNRFFAKSPDPFNFVVPDFLKSFHQQSTRNPENSHAHHRSLIVER